MSKAGLPPNRATEITCDFCRPGTLAAWDVITEDTVLFVCNKHHADMSEANVIRLERRIGEETWDIHLGY